MILELLDGETSRLASGIKVLHVIHSSKGGGAETQLDFLCRYGSPAGIDSVTFCVRSDEELNQGERSYIRYARTRKIDFGIFSAVAAAIQETAPNIVHAWLPPVMTVPALWAAKRSKVPAVFSYRSQKRFRRLLDGIEYCANWLWASGLVSNTPVHQCSWPYQWLYQHKRGTTIPNAVVVPDGLSAQPGPDNSGHFKILFVGRLAPVKNLPCLLRALGAARRKDWSLTICGQGPLRSELESLAADLEVSHQINWLGFRGDVPQLMARHHALVLSSWHEGMPNVVLEALALSLPVVASDIPAIRNALGDSDAALLFPSDDHEALARQLGRLEQTPKLARELSEHGREHAAKYSVTCFIQAYADYYRQVIASSNSTSGTSVS